MLEIRSLSQLREITEDQTLYLRYAADIEGDCRRGHSRNHVTGGLEAGLSVENLTSDTLGDNVEVIAMQIASYAYLLDQGLDGTRGWVLSGDKAGRGADNEPLISDAKVVGALTPQCIAAALRTEQARIERNPAWSRLRWTGGTA